MLGFQGQIILVGLLLSAMEICTSVVLSSAFLLVLARFGRSRLQTYQAILTRKFLTGSNIGKRWRFVLLLSLLLPIGLSVAYKNLLGGTADALFKPGSPGSYGLDFPRIGSWTPSVLNSIYLLLTAFTPFWTAAKQGEGLYPEAREFPLAYGYNTLLLDDDSAAVLDVPTTSYIASLQGQLAVGESFNISADVDAYVASLDPLTASLATNDSLWTQSMAEGGALSTMDLYMGQQEKLGILPCGNNDRMLIGLYYNSPLYGGIRFHNNASDPEALLFRQRAHVYSVRRARCHGAWQLNATGIFLQAGFCNSSAAVDQRVLRMANMQPFAYDVLPPLLQTFNTLVRDNSTDAPWLRPAYAMSVATVYWSRGLYISQKDDNFVSYAPIEEAATSTRSTLRAGWALYLVLAIHPVLTVVGFAVVFWLRKVPVGPDFSMVAIMAGLEPGDLPLLRGAAFSGELESPVRVDVVAEEYRKDGEEGSGGSAGHARIRYQLSTETKGMAKRRTVLKEGYEYE